MFDRWTVAPNASYARLLLRRSGPGKRDQNAAVGSFQGCPSATTCFNETARRAVDPSVEICDS